MTIKHFADLQSVGAAYLSGQIVELRIDSIEEDLARRAIDFASGLVFGTHGRMTKASHGRFLLIPHELRTET
jgi:cell division inhibitor SepF